MSTQVSVSLLCFPIPAHSIPLHAFHAFIYLVHLASIRPFDILYIYPHPPHSQLNTHIQNTHSTPSTQHPHPRVIVGRTCLIEREPVLRGPAAFLCNLSAASGPSLKMPNPRSPIPRSPKPKNRPEHRQSAPADTPPRPLPKKHETGRAFSPGSRLSRLVARFGPCGSVAPNHRITGPSPRYLT
jgi:hypothetical protein